MKVSRHRVIERRLSEADRIKYEHMQEKRMANDDSLMAHMKDYLSTLNDGIIAIFITVMMLEIPFPTSMQEYRQFLWAILIFFVSFFIIADFWYENKRAFETMKKCDHLILLFNFCFLAVLALIPVMTKWVLNRFDRYAAINYGIVYFLALLFQNLLYFAIVRKRFENHIHLFLRMSLVRLGTLIMATAILIVLAWFFPRQIIFLYIALPVISFVLPN